MRISLPSLVGLVGLLLTACGNHDAPPPQGSLPVGPPRWSALPAKKRDGPSQVLIDVRSPARLVLVAEGIEGKPEAFMTREVPAGQSLELAWLAWSRRVRDVEGQDPPAAAAAAGRTDGHVAMLDLGYGDQPGRILREVVWTRPGRGWAEVRLTPPPSIDEEIPFGSEIELVAVALADAPRVRVRLSTVDGETRVRLHEPVEGDRVRLIRLLLRVEEM